jgi:hypothetical protein
MKLTRRSVIWTLLVLWPAILWVTAFGVATIAGLGGCEISARGPNPCIVASTDIGDYLYPLWALGHWAVIALLWVISMGLIWLAVEFVRARM